MSAKKHNQHLENLIKADGFEALPFWYQYFIKQLILLGTQTSPVSIYSSADYLRGYLWGLRDGDLIASPLHLLKMVEEAETHAINNNVKKAA